MIVIVQNKINIIIICKLNKNQQQRALVLQQVYSHFMPIIEWIDYSDDSGPDYSDSD